MGAFKFKSIGLLLVISFLAQGSHGWIRFRYPYSRRVFLQQTSLERLQNCAEQPEEKCGLCGEGPSELPTSTISDQNYITPEVTDNILDVQLAFRADLLGSFEFRLCEVGQDVLTSGRTCRNIPTLELFGDRRSYSPSSRQSSATVPVTIPPGTVCEKCVLQVRYTPGRDPDGLGNHTYYDCAPVTFTATPILALLRNTAETAFPTDQFTSTLLSGSQNSGASSMQGNNVNSDIDRRVASLIPLGNAGDQSVARLVIGNEANQVDGGRLSGGVREPVSSKAPTSSIVENTPAQGFAETVIVRNNISSRTAETTSKNQGQGQSGTNAASISRNDAASASVQTVERRRDGLSGVSFIGGSRVGDSQGSSNAADGGNVLTNTITRTYIIERQVPSNSDVRVTSDNIVIADQDVNTLSGGLFGGLNVNAGNQQQVDGAVNYVVNANGNTLRTSAFGAGDTFVSGDSLRTRINDNTARTVIKNNNILTSSTSNNVVGNLQNDFGNTLAADNMLAGGSFRGVGVGNTIATGTGRTAVQGNTLSTKTVNIDTADNRIAGNSLNTDVVDNSLTRNGNTLVNEGDVSGRAFGAGMMGVLTNNVDSTSNQVNNLASSVVYTETGLGDGRPDNVAVANTPVSRDSVDAAGRIIVGERISSRGDLATDAVILDNTMTGNGAMTRENEISSGTVTFNTGTGMGGRLNTVVDDGSIARNSADSRITANSVDNTFVNNGGMSGVNRVTVERTATGSAFGTGVVENAPSEEPEITVIRRNNEAGRVVTVNSGENVVTGTSFNSDVFVDTAEPTLSESTFGNRLVGNTVTGVEGNMLIRGGLGTSRTLIVNSVDGIVDDRFNNIVDNTATRGIFNTNGNRLTGGLTIASGGIGTGLNGNTITGDRTVIQDNNQVRNAISVNTDTTMVDSSVINNAGRGVSGVEISRTAGTRTEFTGGIMGNTRASETGNTVVRDITVENGQNNAYPNTRFVDGSLKTAGAESAINSNSLNANGNVNAKEDSMSSEGFRTGLTGNTATRTTEDAFLINDFPMTDSGRMADGSLNDNVRANGNILGFDRTVPSGVLGLGDRSRKVDSSTIIRGNISSGTLTVKKNNRVAGDSGMIGATTVGRSATISEITSADGSTLNRAIGTDGRNNAMSGQTSTRVADRSFVTGTQGSDDINNVIGGRTGTRVAQRTFVTGTLGLDNINNANTGRTVPTDADRKMVMSTIRSDDINTIAAGRTGTTNAESTVVSGTIRSGDNIITGRTGTTFGERAVVTGTATIDDVNTIMSGQRETTRDVQDIGRTTILTNTIGRGSTTLTNAVESIDSGNIISGPSSATFVRASDVPRRTATSNTDTSLVGDSFNNIVKDNAVGRDSILVDSNVVSDGRTLVTGTIRTGETNNMVTDRMGTRVVQGNSVITNTIDADRTLVSGSTKADDANNMITDQVNTITDETLVTGSERLGDTSYMMTGRTGTTVVQGNDISSRTITIDANRNAIDGSFTDVNTVASGITSNFPADGTRGTNIQGSRVSSGTLTANVNDRLAAGPVNNKFVGRTDSSFGRNTIVGEMDALGNILGDSVIGKTMTDDSGMTVNIDTSGVVGIDASGRKSGSTFSTSSTGMFGSTHFDVSASSLDNNLSGNTLDRNFIGSSAFDNTLSSNLASVNGDLPVDDTRISFDRNTLGSNIVGSSEASRRTVGDFSTNFVDDRVIDRGFTRTSVSTGTNNILVDPRSKMLMVALSGGRKNGENVLSGKTVVRNEEQFMTNGVLSTSNNIASVSSVDSVVSNDAHTNNNTLIYNASENVSGSTVSNQAELFINDSKTPVESLFNDTLISSFDRTIQSDSSQYDNRMTLDISAGKVVVGGGLTESRMAGNIDINNVNDAYFDQTTSATNTETNRANNVVSDTNIANRGINTRDWRYHDSFWYGFGDEASTTTSSTSVADESYIQNNTRPIYDTVAVDTVQTANNRSHTDTSGQALQHQEIVSVPNTITVFPLNTPIPMTTGRSKQGDIDPNFGTYQNIPTTQSNVVRSETTTTNPRSFQSFTDIPTQTTGIPFPADNIAPTTQRPITDIRQKTFSQETTKAYDYVSSPNTHSPFIYDRYDGTSTKDWRYVDTSTTRQGWSNSQTNGQKVVGLDIGTSVNDLGLVENRVTSRDMTKLGTSSIVYDNTLTSVNDASVNYQSPVDTIDVINTQSGSTFSDSMRNVDPVNVPSTDLSRFGFYDVTTQRSGAGFNGVSTTTTRPINMATNKEPKSIVYDGATVVRDYPNIVSGGHTKTVTGKTIDSDVRIDVHSDVRSKGVDAHDISFDRNTATKQKTESIITIVSESPTVLTDISSPQPRIPVNNVPTFTATVSPGILYNDIMPTTVRDPQIMYDSPNREIPVLTGIDQSVSVSADSTEPAVVNTVQSSETNYTLIGSGMTNVGKTTSSKTQDVSFMDLVGNVDSFGGVPIDNGKTSGSGSFFILSKPSSSQTINRLSDGKSFDVTNSLSSDSSISDTVRTGFVVYNFSDIASNGGSFDSSVVPVQDRSGSSFSDNQILPVADILRNGDTGVSRIRANTNSETRTVVGDSSLAPITMPPIVTTEKLPETPIVSRVGVTDKPIAGTGVQYEVNTGSTFGTALLDNVNSIKTVSSLHNPVATSTVWKGLGIIRNTPADVRSSDKATPVDVNDQFTYHYFNLMQGSNANQQGGSRTKFEKVPEAVKIQNSFDPYLTTSLDAQQGSVNLRDDMAIRSNLDRNMNEQSNLNVRNEVLLTDDDVNKTDISNKNISSSTLWDLNRRNKDAASASTNMDTSASTATSIDTSASVATSMDTVNYDVNQDFPMEWVPITDAGLDAQFLDQLAPNNMPPIIVKFADGTPDRQTQTALQNALRTASETTLQTGTRNINENKDDVTIRILQTLEELITELKKKDPTMTQQSLGNTLVADGASATELRRDIGVNMRDVTRDTGFNTVEGPNTGFNTAIQQNAGFYNAVQQNTGFDTVEQHNAGFNTAVQQNTGFDTMVQPNTGFDNVARQDMGIEMVTRTDMGANTNVRTSAAQGSTQSNSATDMFYFTDPVNMDVPPPIFPGDSTVDFTGVNEIGTIKLSNLEGVTEQRQWSPGVDSNQINIDKVGGAARQRLNISESRFKQPLIRLPNQKGSMYQILTGNFANVSATKRKAIEEIIANKIKEEVVNTHKDATLNTANFATEFNTATSARELDTATRAGDFATTNVDRTFNKGNPTREVGTANRAIEFAVTNAGREFMVASSELPLSNETKTDQIRRQRVINFTDRQIRNPFAGTNIQLHNVTDKLGNIMATEPQYRASSDFATLDQSSTDFATLGQFNTAERGFQPNSDRNLISIEGKYYIGEMRRNNNGQFEPVPMGADVLLNTADAMQLPSQSRTRTTNAQENNVVMPGKKRPTVYINLPTEVGSDIQGNRDFINQNSLLEVIKRQQDVTNVGVDSKRVLERTQTPAASNRVFETLPASNTRTETNRVFGQTETLVNSFAPSPGPKAVVCREGEKFACKGVGSYQNIPGMVWWCFSHCKNGVCPQEKCDCSCEVSSRAFMSAETPQINTRPIVVSGAASTDNTRVRKVINLTLNGSKESLIRVGEGFSRTSEKILQPDTRRDSGSQSQRLGVDAGTAFRMDSTQGGTTERRRALLLCRGINAFADTAGMDRWCTTMCRRDVCPAEICACNV